MPHASQPGQLLFAGFPGTTLPDDLAALIDAAVGGALATLHEAAAGGTGQASLDANVSYIGAVRDGSAFVEGRILRRGGTIAFGEAEVRDEAGTLAAKGRVTYMILRPRT